MTSSVSVVDSEEDTILGNPRLLGSSHLFSHLVFKSPRLGGLVLFFWHLSGLKEAPLLSPLLDLCFREQSQAGTSSIIVDTGLKAGPASALFTTPSSVLSPMLGLSQVLGLCLRAAQVSRLRISILDDFSDSGPRCPRAAWQNGGKRVPRDCEFYWKCVFYLK